MELGHGGRKIGLETPHLGTVLGTHVRPLGTANVLRAPGCRRRQYLLTLNLLRVIGRCQLPTECQRGKPLVVLENNKGFP